MLKIYAQVSLLKCTSQPEITNNSLKPPIWEIQGYLRSSMLTFLRSSSPVVLLYAACLCLSATIFTLDEPTAVE